MTATQLIVLAIFATTYVCLVLAFRWRLLVVAVACGALLLWPGLMTVESAVRSINWNVILLYFGMLFLAETLIVSRAPAVLAEKLVREGLSARWAIILICVAAGVISSVVENVATVLIVAPVALAVARRLKISPAPMLIGVAVCSNLQGAATMVGDPPSMLLAGAMKMNFNDFFWYRGRPSIFFAVELGAVASLLVLWFIFRKYRGQAGAPEQHRLASRLPLVLLAVLVVCLAASSVVVPGWKYAAGVLSVAFGFGAAVWWIIHHGAREFLRQVWKLDWGTGFFIIGIFVVVGSLVENKVADRFAALLASLSGDSVFLAYSLAVWGSVVGSAFIDNVPFVAAMLPVCIGLASRLGVPSELVCFGMMVGASIGGNISPVGASANIVAVGIAKREREHVSFRRFAAIGLPFTVVATAAAYAFLWVFWR